MTMVEETIRTIKATEAQADTIVKEAEAKSREIVSNALKAAAVRQKSAQEVSALKEAAQKKEKEAVDLVISQLV